MDLVSLLVAVLIIGLIAWVFIWIIGLLPVAQPFKNVALAIGGLILLIYLISLLPGGLPGVHLG